MKKQFTKSAIFFSRIIVCAFLIMGGATPTMAAPPTGPLCGAYTIGGVTPDFNDLNDAINYLNANGVSCAAVFNIRDGSYAAGQTINSITGSNVSNTVTFQSESGIAANVTLTSSYYDITLNSASNVQFRNLTFYASNTFYTIGGIYTNPYTFNLNVIVDHCIFNIVATYIGYNSYGIYAYYSDCSGMQITNNTFDTVRYPVYIYGYLGYPNTDILVADNVMTGTYYGVYGYYLGSIKILRNQISMDWPSYTTYGVYLYYTPSYNIEKNKISSTGSGAAYGIYLYYCNGSSPRSTLVNNFIEVGGSMASFGIYLYYVSFLDIFHNSVNNICTDPSGSAYYRYFGNDIDINNNIFVNTGGGYAIYVSGNDPSIDYDFNDYYVTGSYLGNLNGSNAVDLPAWRTLYGLDANSISVDPNFTSATDLHVSNLALNNVGQPNGVTDDIDGNPRNMTTPDIGGDEFGPVAPIPTLPQWGLMIIFASFLGFGSYFLTRKGCDQMIS